MIGRNTLIIALCISAVGVSAVARAQAPTLANAFPFGDGTQVKPGTVEVIPMTDLVRNDPRYQQAASAVEQQRSRGWVEVDEQKAASIDSAFVPPSTAGLTHSSIEPLRNALRLAPASLRGTVLGRGTLDGVRTAGGFVNGGWTGLVRLFTVPGLGRVVLEEYDYVAAGSHFRVPEDTIDSFANGYPVIYRVFRAPSGRAYTDVVWFTGTKQFRLMIDGQITKSTEAYADIQRLLETLA